MESKEAHTGLGHAHHAADDQHVLGGLYREDGVPKERVELGGHVADVLAAGGVAVFPRAGKGLYKAQLLDVPGNSGPGSRQSRFPAGSAGARPGWSMSCSLISSRIFACRRVFMGWDHSFLAMPFLWNIWGANPALLPGFDDFLVEDVVKVVSAQADKAGAAVRREKAQLVAGGNLQGRFAVHGEVGVCRCFRGCSPPGGNPPQR